MQQLQIKQNITQNPFMCDIWYYSWMEINLLGLLIWQTYLQIWNTYLYVVFVFIFVCEMTCVYILYECNILQNNETNKTHNHYWCNNYKQNKTSHKINLFVIFDITVVWQSIYSDCWFEKRSSKFKTLRCMLILCEMSCVCVCFLFFLNETFCKQSNKQTHNHLKTNKVKKQYIHGMCNAKWYCKSWNRLVAFG